MARRSPLTASWLVALALGACTVEDVVLVAPIAGGSGLRGVVVEPRVVRVVDDGVPPAEQVAFRAIGRYDDGERTLEHASWRLEDPRLGAVAGGAFTAAGVGGTTAVVAEVEGLSARAEITVALDATVIAPGLDPAIAAAFPADTSSDAADASRLSIAYPTSETMFPANARGVRHEWRAAPELDRFQLTYSSPLARVRVYTDQRRFAFEDDAWRRLAATHAGGAVEVTLRGLSSAAPARILAAPKITLDFARGAITGTAYYWSTAAQAILRARLDDASATRAFPATPGTCTGCHTVSRDGRRIAFLSGERLQLDRLDPRAPPARGEAYGWGSFSPDGARLVYAKEGQLSILDLATGEHTEVALPGGAAATHPDWSPDGTFIAVVYRAPPGEDEPLGDQDVSDTSLARLPVSPGGVAGAPQLLVRSAGDDDTIAFPAVSPDGALIAFARMRGESKDNPTAELYLVRSDGAGGPVPLLRANRRAGDRTLATGAGNTMPTWAPSDRADVLWLVFSSVRPYGLEPTDGITDQLWSAAIDPARVRPGDDPSWAAFWLPFQALGEGNHRAQWAP